MKWDRSKVVIFTSDLYRGGVAYSASKLFDALESDNVYLITYEKFPQTFQTRSPIEVQCLNCFYSRTSHQGKVRRFFVRFLRYPMVLIATFRFFRYLKTIAKDGEEITVFSMTLAPVVVSCLTKLLFLGNLKLVTSERQDPGLDFAKNMFLKFIISACYRYSDVVHVNSIGLKGVLQEEFRVPAHKIRVVCNVVQKPVDILEKLLRKNIKAIESKNVKAVFAGRLSNQKATYLLAPIVRALVDWGYKVQLDIYGDGENADAIYDSSCKLKVEKFINFKGNVRNVSEHFDDYNIGLFTSNFESFGNVLGEFFSHGLVIIASDTRCGLINYVSSEVAKIAVMSEDDLTNGRFSAAINKSLRRISRNSDARTIASDYTRLLSNFTEENHEVNMRKLLWKI